MPHDEEARDLLESLEVRASDAEKQVAEARNMAWWRKYGWY